MKRFIAILTSLVMLLACLSLCIHAEEITIDFGTDTITYRVIDFFEGDDSFVDGWASLGNATIKDGKIVMVTNNGMFDAYGVSTKAIGSSDWSGMKYIVFAITNTSDGDVYFCFQPTAEGGGNLYNNASLAKDNPVYLYDNDKQTFKAAKWSGAQAINNRDAFIIPWKFNGFIYIPIANLAQLGVNEPAMPENGSFFDYGFHCKPDDATYVEMTINAIYACGDLPEFHAAEAATPAPATEPATPAPATEPATEEPVEDPETVTAHVDPAPTEAPTSADTPIEAGTAADEGIAADTGVSTAADATEAGTADAGSGCASVIGASAVIVLMAACAAFVRKHDSHR